MTPRCSANETEYGLNSFEKSMAYGLSVMMATNSTRAPGDENSRRARKGEIKVAITPAPQGSARSTGSVSEKVEAKNLLTHKNPIGRIRLCTSGRSKMRMAQLASSSQS